MKSNKISKTLIIGSSSYLGQYLINYFKPSELILTHKNNPNSNSIFFDMNKDSLDKILERNTDIKKSVILCGIHKYNVINDDPEKAYEVNVKNIKKILMSLKLYNVMPIFTSSDNVFDGKKGKYLEEDNVNPTFYYAKHKVEIENFIKDKFTNYQIYRISKIIDTNIRGNTLIVDWINKLKRNETIVCAYNNRFSPIEVNDLCLQIKKLIFSETNGVFHLSSNTDLSRKQMLEMFLRKVPASLKMNKKIIYTKLNNIKGCEQQPLKISLNANKTINITKFKPKLFGKIIDEILKKYNF
jgi:dTDP-4-dehydrorhamnose reductase